MKKFFAFVVAMAMTVVANAGLVTFADNGAALIAKPGDTVVVSITTDSALLGLNAVVTVEGDAAITAASGKAQAAALGWDAGLSFDATVSDARAEVGFGNFGGKATGVAATFSILYKGGIVDVVLTPGSAFGGSMDSSFGAPDIAGALQIVPEPMTMALLSLGGLVAARRRRA